eukprot:gene26933-33583_t
MNSIRKILQNLLSAQSFAAASWLGLGTAISATNKMRIQLAMSVGASIVFLIIADTSYTNLCVSTALFGFAGASIFPLAMVVITDCGFAIDPRSTSLFMMAATFGDASIPISIGQLMKYTNRQAFTYMMFAIAVCMVMVSIAVHYLGNYVDDVDSGGSSVKNPMMTLDPSHFMFKDKVRRKTLSSKQSDLVSSSKKRQHFTLGAAIAIQANSEITLGVVSSLHGRAQHSRSVVSQRKATLESRVTYSGKSTQSVVITTSDKAVSTFTPQTQTQPVHRVEECEAERVMEKEDSGKVKVEVSDNTSN